MMSVATLQQPEQTDLVKQEAPAEVATVERTRGTTTYTPRVDIAESSDEMLLFADMPGVEQGNLDLRFDNGQLIIEGRVAPRYADETFLCAEYGIGDFYRAFSINEDIDAEKISAELKNGVLTVHLPKTEALKPRKIEVKAS